MDLTSRIYTRRCLQVLASAALLMLCGASAARAALSHSTLSVDRIEGSKLVFKETGNEATPGPIDTGLSELQVLAHLPVSLSPTSATKSGIAHQAEPSDAPWVLVLGKPCQQCSSDEKDLFLIRPTTGEMHQINLPGKIVDPKAGALVHESRAFYGQCVDGKKAGVFVFQREKVDRKNRLASSYYSAEAGASLLEETLLEKHFPSLKRTLQKVKTGDCTEIPTRNRTISGKINEVQGQNLASRMGLSDEDDEDENDPALRRATVGSEDSLGDTDSEEDEETDDASAQVHAPASPMSRNEGARIASPQDSARELKSRITSPIKKSSANSQAGEGKRL